MVNSKCITTSVSSLFCKYCTNIVCVLCLELSLEREREAFRIATVQPVHQLRDDLRFRLSEVQHQQLTCHPSNWVLVKQQVPVCFEIQTCLQDITVTYMKTNLEWAQFVGSQYHKNDKISKSFPRQIDLYCLSSTCIL